MTDVTVHPPEEAGAFDDEPIAPLSTAPDQAAGEGPPGPRRSPVVALRRGWRQLTSMRTALILLFLLALAAVPGSLIPQRGLNAAKVRQFFTAHPTLAPILDRLSLFDVFAAPWFAAIYLLLFVSLIGCLTPRVRLHIRALRAKPPAAPRRLSRLSSHADFTTDLDPAAAVSAARGVLARRRFRVDVREEAAGAHSVAAEKGYLRETGNLLFHISLVVLLVGIALGGLFGYKGDVLVKEGDGFANIRSSYDDFTPARLFGDRELAPFSFSLKSFHASYQPNGEARTFDADVRYRTSPGGPQRSYDIRVNHPLAIAGVKIYLLGHGYAPHVVVRDPKGHVAFDAAVPFLPRDATFLSDGVIKVPDAQPRQIGFAGFFAPTAAIDPASGMVSAFPGARRPALVLTAYHGNLGLDNGVPLSVFSLDLAKLTQYTDGSGQPLSKLLTPGSTWTLPDGTSITFTGLEQYGTFQVTHDPGKRVALIAAALIVLGLILSLRVRRRRLWVRARPAEGADGGRRTVVEVGGLARTDADSFAEEFDGLVEKMRAATGTAQPNQE